MSFDQDPHDEITMAASDFAILVDERKILIEALKEARRAIGDHYAPNDCYATGPLTGNEFRDLVQCPACSAIAMYDETIKKVGAV